MAGLPPPGHPLLSGAEAAACLEGAYEVIAEIGIEVPNEVWRRKVLAATGRERATRVCFSREEVDGYLRRWRERNGLGEPGWPDEAPWPYAQEPTIALSVMPYCHTYHDPRTDALVPLTAARALEATRFLGTFYGQGVHATATGHAADVPPALQPVLQYKLAAQYNPAGGGCGWFAPPGSAAFIYRMAEVMGAPIDWCVVYVFSPLRLGGEELGVTIAHRERLRVVHVGNMGSVGGTLPICPKAALALAWAETIAGAMCVEALTGLPANWGGGIEPFDLRAQVIPFGAPEQALFRRLSHEAGAWVRGQSPWGGGVGLLTMAKQPGAQAALEKGTVAAHGASYGITSLEAGGSLSCDEVFSPVQLLLDCELRDWLTRLAQGLEHPDDTPDRALHLIREGLAAGSFSATDTTLDHYRDVYWFPRHSRREMLGAWERLGRPDAVESARQEALDRIESATWVLPEPQFGQLEAIWEAARRASAP